MVCLLEESLYVIAITHDPVLRNFLEEPLEALFTLLNLFRFVLVPVGKSVLRWDGRNYACWVTKPQNVIEPFKITVPPVH